ncbi:MAG: glycosyltransferase [Bacteroidales bacterium]|nr:glycosyltransferase [Bacteroidales bacterium]
MSILFFISVFLLFHSYILYPILLWLFAFNKRLSYQHYGHKDELPSVSVVMAAYNEEAVVESKLMSVLATDYPLSRVEIIVGSDCSTDSTDDILKKIAQEYPQVTFVGFAQRQGKIAIINHLLAKASGSIIISTDANVMFTPSTIFELVKYFKDERIGLVDSRMVHKGLSKTGISIQESTYITHEVMIKHREGLLWGTMIGPFGGCYAIRKELFCSPPANFLVDDFYINMKVIEQGKKCINNLHALAIEDVSNVLQEEFRRKVRIGMGNFQNLGQFAGMLWPPTKPVAFSFLSHKVLRWLGPILLLLALVSTIALSFQSVFFHWVLVAFVVMLAIPLVDFICKSIKIHISPLRFVTHFFSMNLALLVGLIKYFKGVKSNVWQPTQRNQ